MEQDVRWKQRFANFENAYASLREVLERRDIEEEVRIDAAIKHFELVFELAWKTLQDYLLAQGYIEYKGPRSVIGKSYQDKLIDDGLLWFLMLEDRNTLVHAYDFDKSRLVYKKIIADYLILIEQFNNRFKNESTK